MVLDRRRRLTAAHSNRSESRIRASLERLLGSEPAGGSLLADGVDEVGHPVVVDGSRVLEEYWGGL